MTNQIEQRVIRVLDHIHAHPGADLSLDALSDVAAMSRFHWHRVFKAVTGETCAQAVRRIRLHLAASEMIYGSDPLATIAARNGYPSFDSFARAFRSRYSLGPTAYRNRGVATDAVPRPKEITMSFPVEIRNADAIRLIGTPHIGAYYKISEAFSRLGAIIGSRGLWPQTGNMVGIFYDSPHDTPEDQLNSFAAVQTGIDAPEGLELREIPAGERAILTLKGPYSGLQAAYDYLYGPWLAASDRSPSDAPSFEIYLNSPLDTAQGDLLTEIHLPLS